MTVNDLISLYDYGYWVNKKLFPVIARLSPEEFTQTVAGSYGSIRNTLAHVISAEWGWLDRCGGPARGPALKAENFPTVESLIETGNKVETYVREFLLTLKDADLARKVEFSLGPAATYSMPIGELLHHAAIHGVHHRGQVALLLRSLGYTPGNFDILFYYGSRLQEAAS